MGRVRIGSGVAVLAVVAASAGAGAAALAAGGSGIAGATTLPACPPAVISGTTATVTCSYNGTTGTDGSPQTWTVPAGVTQATFDVYGAQGGGGSPSGPGGEAEGTLPVVPGSTLQINVGGQATGITGGFNGGGNASIPGGPTGGGGASDVRDGSYGLADRLVVAGGGGGDGFTDGFGVPVEETGGGAGGGVDGGLGVGDPTSCSSNSPCGTGGTNTAGGAGGQTVPCDGFPGVQVLELMAPTNGSFGIGGSGGYVSCMYAVSADPITYTTLNSGGAGGGGGWFGGGGGAVDAEALPQRSSRLRAREVAVRATSTPPRPTRPCRPASTQAMGRSSLPTRCPAARSAFSRPRCPTARSDSRIHLPSKPPGATRPTPGGTPRAGTCPGVSTSPLLAYCQEPRRRLVTTPSPSESEIRRSRDIPSTRPTLP